MARVVKVVKTLRNHWKKSTVAAILGYLGLNYAYDRHKTFMIMREYGMEALVHGRRKLPTGAKNKHITLLLNPTAGNRKAKAKLEKYGEPLLHLSGFLVSTVKTERIDEAKDLAGIIEKTNVLAVAGGDGTVFETVTGLLRRDDADEAVLRYPIGILPVGGDNKFAKHLFKASDDATEAKFIADAAMAIINHRMKPVDVMEIQIAETESAINNPENEDGINPDNEKVINPENDNVINIESKEKTVPVENVTPTPSLPKKPFYSLIGINMGQYREAKKISDSMPSIFGQYFRTFWSLLRVEPAVVKAEINYIPTCAGCYKCKKAEEERLAKQRKIDAEKRKNLNIHPQSSSIWSRITSVFSGKTVLADDQDQTNDEDIRENIIVNPECGVQKSLCVDTTELNILVNGGGKLRVEIGRKLGRTDFMIEGLKRLKGETPNYNVILDCSELEVCPVQGPEFFAIDSEEFEVKRVKLKVIKDRVNLFVR